MRKLFIATLLLTIGCGTPAFAATQCESIQADTCDATAGCYLEVNNNTCQPCPAGTYKGSGDPSCLPCGDKAPVTWNKNTTGLTSQSDCAYTATCQAHYYFGGYNTGCTPCYALNDSQNNKYYYGTKTTEYEVTGTVGNDASNLNDACATCGENSITKDDQGTGCRCIDGYHVKEGTNGDINNDATDCDPNQYTITYIASKDPNDQTPPKKQTATYSQYITLLGDDTFKRNGYELDKWEKSDENLTFTPGEQIPYNYRNDIELTAVWAGKEFTITYNVNGATDCGLSDQMCRFGTKCPVKDVNNCKKPGYVFRGWQCTSGCENNNEIINLGNNISELSGGADMTLTAIWAECPAGYYCPNIKTENKCPAGSTSAAKSAAITNCYMTGGTTKILDAAGNEFILPGTEKIYYHGGNN